MNLNENHQAAGVNATAARQTVKDGWKKGFLPHVVIGITAFTIGVVVLNTYELNLFWKLLIGYSMVWAGGKISGTKNAVAVTWGKATTMIGWAIIALALLNSGVRQVAEKTVIWADQGLSEMSGLEGGQAGKILDSLKTEQKITSHIEFRGVHKAEPKVVVMAFNTIAVASLDMGHVSTGPNWACPEVIKPAKLPFDVYFEVVAGKGTTQNHIMLTKESQQTLLENGTMAVTVRFTHMIAHQNPCANLR